MDVRQLPVNPRAWKQRLKEARLGDPVAQYELGLMYANGTGIKRDLKHALTWFHSAANKGHLAAQYLMGSAYASGAGTEKNELIAAQWFMRAYEQGSDKASLRLAKLLETAHQSLAHQFCLMAAEAGLADAQLMLGDHFASAQNDSHDKSAARYWYQKAADQGLAIAQKAIGDMLAQGLGGPVDLAAASAMYRAAAREGNAAAQLALHQLDAQGHGRSESRRLPRNRPSAHERRTNDAPWILAAQRGGPSEKFHLAQMYESGIGVEKSLRQAKRWYQHAAEQGHTGAQLALARLLEAANPELAAKWYERAISVSNPSALFALAKMHAEGRGVEPDLWKSLLYYARAAEGGDTSAILALSKLLMAGNEAAAIAGFMRAAELGDAEAQYFMGQRSLLGQGVKQNDRLAAHSLRLAAAQGIADAQCALAGLYAKGRGVEPDLIEAARWYELAAAQGSAEAQWALGEMIAAGRTGLDADVRQATLMCKRAANAGYGPAQATLGNLFAQAEKFDRAAYWWLKASEQGDAEAQINLANAYRTGRGVAVDKTRAFELLIRAAEGGVALAQALVGVCYVTGEGVAVDPIEGTKWFLIASSKGDASARKNVTNAQSLLTKAQLDEASRRADAWLVKWKKP